MSEDIFDYFGGKSPRKVKPLEEDDFFGDLISKDDTESPSSDASAASDVKADAIDDDQASKEPQQASERPRASSRPRSAAAPGPKAMDKKKRERDEKPAVAADGGSHWDSLASTLGLESSEPKQVSKAQAASTPETDDIIAAEEVELVTEDEPVSQANSPVDSLFEVTAEDRTNVEEEVLSEMFTADRSDDERPERDTPRSTKKTASVATEAPVDDDPFAAFHRVPESEVTEAEDSADTFEPEEEVDTLVVTDDFVEFDIKDLNSGKSEPRRRKRRSERKPEGRSEGDSEARETSSRGGRGRGKGRNQGDRDQGSRDQGGRSDRGKRNEKSRGERDDRNQDRHDQNEDSHEDQEQRNEGGRGERGRGGRDRPARRKRSEREGSTEQRGHGRGADRAVSENDDLPEGEDKRTKRPKIPTWEDAIGSVVEKNIRRHGSSNKSDGRRGGGRRRR